LSVENGKLKIQCQQLTIGMTIVELDRAWVDSLFTVHGFTISTQAEINKLQQNCNYVYIANSSAVKNAPHKQSYSNTQTFQQAFPQAKAAHRQAKSVVTGFLNNLRLGQELDTSVAKKAVKQCVDSVIANQDALLWLSLLKDVDEYTAIHSLNVGMLSIILGRAEGLTPQELELVGLCGMLHDMGKSKIPLEILNKEGAFSEAEFEVMKTHTTFGYEILSQKNDLSDEIANVAHSHHERLNGRGYPRALKAKDISYFSRIVSIADAYDAITSKRVYSPSKTSLEALRILISAKGSHFDPQLVDRFVDAIGIYPAGSVAELSNGEIALLLPSPLEQRHEPLVLVVRDSAKRSCPEKRLDLSRQPTDSNGKIITIKHLLSDDAFGINLHKHHAQET
jgi:HD-GYP domain-containing protein (c-di-GMP phosphodiesterase class II)